MRQFARLSLFTFCALSLTGCISFDRREQNQLRELRSLGISQTDRGIKHPALAGALNLFWGFGNFYLASGRYHKNELDMWTFGALNLILWPLSILWGVPEGAIDANSINKIETIHYYYYDPMGRAELERIKRERGVPTAPPPG